MSPSRRSFRSSWDSSKPSVVIDGVQPAPARVARFEGSHEQARARQPSPAHAPAELVKLGDAEAVRVQDDHQGGIMHVHAHLDDGGGYQQLGLVGREGGHGL